MNRNFLFFIVKFLPNINLTKWGNTINNYGGVTVPFFVCLIVCIEF